MYSQLPLNALRMFEAVARLKSFQAAADELHVTPSAVSHQMRQLEDWAGRRLVERTAQGIKLLPEAAGLAQILTGALHDITAASRQLRQPDGERHLVIAVIPSVATCWLIPKLSAFRALHPEISTRIMYAIHGQPIDFEDVDVAITYAAAPPRPLSGIDAEKLLPGDSAPVCSAAFLELNGPFSTPDSIIRAGLLHDTDMLGWQRWMSLAGTTVLRTPEGPVFEDFNLLRAATLAGQGISLCPLSIIHDDLMEQRLHQLSPLTILAESGYYVQTRTARAPAPDGPLALFLNWIRSRANRPSLTDALRAEGSGPQKSVF